MPLPAAPEKSETSMSTTTSVNTRLKLDSNSLTFREIPGKARPHGKPEFDSINVQITRAKEQTRGVCSIRPNMQPEKQDMVVIDLTQRSSPEQNATPFTGNVNATISETSLPALSSFIDPATGVPKLPLPGANTMALSAIPSVAENKCVQDGPPAPPSPAKEALETAGKFVKRKSGNWFIPSAGISQYFRKQAAEHYVMKEMSAKKNGAQLEDTKQEE